MKRFEFSLQRVLDVKETEEKVLQRNLALAQCELQVARELEEEFERQLQRELNSMNEVGRKTTTSGEMLLHRHYLESIQAALDQQRQTVADLSAKAEEARMALLQKTKEKKSLEVLKEGQFETYTREKQKFEQAFLDEITAQNSKFHIVGGNS